MQHSAFISIIMVCYNYAHLLPHALDAIALQKFQDYELVFVDNGCTDNSVEVLNAFRKSHPNIRIKLVTVEKNIGLSYGENKGVDAATGKYLMFHDADDWMDYNTLECLAAAAKSNNADRVIASFRDVDEQGRVKQIQYLGKEPIGWLYGMQQANLFRTSIYKEKHISTGTLWVDAEKTFKFSAYCHRCAFVFEPCYNYLVHLDSTSRNKTLHERFYTDSDYSFEKFMRNCIPYLPSQDNNDRIMAEYQLARYYYSYIFQFSRDAPLNKKMEIYRILNQTMKKYLPFYLNSVSLALKDNNATRPYAWRIAKLASTLEKMHLMKFGLIIYHIFSKFYFFRI